MTESRNDEADRIAGGTGGGTGTASRESEDLMPGEIGGGQTYLPADGRGGGEGTTAASADNTIGAAGEMDFTGAPAGTSGAGGGASGGSNTGASVGGGTGGGSMSSGGGTGAGEGEGG